MIYSAHQIWGMHGGGKNAYRILVGKYEEKTPLGRYRNRWENNIRIKLKITGW
jgi:hypothetical protein